MVPNEIKDKKISLIKLSTTLLYNWHFLVFHVHSLSLFSPIVTIKFIKK